MGKIGERNHVDRKGGKEGRNKEGRSKERKGKGDSEGRGLN